MEAKALLKFGAQSKQQMRMPDAEAAFRKAVEVTSSAQDLMLQARALAGLHDTLGLLGRARESQPLLMEALRTCYQRPEAGAAQVIVESCLIYFVPPDSGNADTLLEDLIPRAQRPEHARDVDIARSLGRIAVYCNRRGEREVAAELLERALPVMEIALGAGNAEFALMLYNLADLRGSMYGYDKEEPLIRRAIAIQDAALAPNHPEKAAPLLTLGMLLCRTRRYAESRALFERALAIALAFEGNEGPTVAMAHQGLALLADALANDDGAKPVLLQAVAAAEADPAAKPYDIAERLTTVCRFLFARGQVAEAVPHYRKLRAILEKLGELERGVLDAQMGIPGGIYVLLQQGQSERAEALLRSMLAAMEALLPPDHEDRLALLYFTGNVYRMMGRHEEALGMFQITLDAARARRRPGDPANLDVLERVLDALLELKRREAAAKVADEIQRLCGIRPICDPALNQIRRELGAVWQFMQLERAPPLLQDALEGDPLAQHVVGLCFEAGLGVASDPGEACAWYERAAKAGHMDATRRAAALKGGANVAAADLQLIAQACADWLKRG